MVRAMTANLTIGDQLRSWRQHRRLSQLDLALEANISPRHLSFVETGRAQPSRTMILHLCEQLGGPLRERNLLLLAAGFAPIFPERALDGPALAAARAAIGLVVDGHEPYLPWRSTGTGTWSAPTRPRPGCCRGSIRRCWYRP
jgi:transcriptional regulator with XRE-family HTH domain